MNTGKVIRLSRIFDAKTQRTLIVPLDDALLSGPEEGLRDCGKKVKEIVHGGANAIMGFRGLFERYYNEMLNISGILNLTASTTRSKHTRKVLVSHVEEAVRLGMDGVGVHVNVGSEFESEMLKILGEISRECELFGMPLMAIMYPRTERGGADYNYEDLKQSEPQKYAELVRHAAHIGVELGADFIKTQFTGDSETFKTVVESCFGIPIIIAGGPKVSVDAMLQNAYYAIKGGAKGISFGRNSFNREDSTTYIMALSKIIHEGYNFDDAKQFIK